jgi:hypothetical protein
MWLEATLRFAAGHERDEESNLIFTQWIGRAHELLKQERLLQLRGRQGSSFEEAGKRVSGQRAREEAAHLNHWTSKGGHVRSLHLNVGIEKTD